MGIISWIILGLIAGFIGSKIVDKQGQGFWLNIALGIVGALVGGFLFDLFGATGVVMASPFLFAHCLARTLSQERVPHHSKRACSNPLLQTMSR